MFGDSIDVADAPELQVELAARGSGADAADTAEADRRA